MNGPSSSAIARIMALIAFAVASTSFSSFADAQMSVPASWSPPSLAEVKTQLAPWLDKQAISEEQKQGLDVLWNTVDDNLRGAHLLDQLAGAIASVHPGAKEVVVFCQGPRPIAALPEFAVLTDDVVPTTVRYNLRLLYGQWLARHDMHEEALVQFDALAPNDVVDPAALLFYRSVCHHRLRDKEACLTAIAQLLENETAAPRRYQEVAKLMQADLEPLKPDTLDEVARLMDSIRRRLDLARVGQRVQSEEEQVIVKLDKMIEELEKQRQPSDGGPADGSSNSPQPATPQDDSRAGGQRGKGDVDPRKLQNNADWGNLPPKQRQEALQQISKELPAHYREAVEEYFRKLARESDQ